MTDSPAVGAIRRPWVAALLLLAVYGGLSLLLDPGGYLGTDTGAKVATLSAMEERDSWRPEVGYWAEEWDPEGRLHPLYDTRLVDGRWVNVTTLPMLEAAHPLYDLGGYRLALLLPMLGAVGAALAARALVRRMGQRSAGTAAFWVIGLASPMVVYALDLWEHSAGVALVVSGVVLLAGRLDDRPELLGAAGAGACFGAAATMRTEALVYAVVAVGAAALWHIVGRRLVAGVWLGASAVAGFAVPWVANMALEATVGGQDRGARASGAVSGRADQLGVRAEEAVQTTFDLGSTGGGALLIAGLLVSALVIAAVRIAPRRAAVAERLALAVAVVYLVRWLDGPSFTSGFLAALPVAAAGLAGRWDALPGATRYVVLVAGGALPLVWLFQFTGGAGPQWGGRYVLPSAVLLGTVGVAGVVALERRRIAALLLASCVAISALGVAWTAERTHAVADTFEQLAVAPDDVVIVPNGFLVREGGAVGLERRFLSVGRGATVDDAVEVAREAGLEGFAVFTEAARTPLEAAGATVVGERPLGFLGVAFVLRSYRFDR